ncbi:hypothetical protein JTE90_013790 [Oedothorax gibbosus]|uniref:Uncharacterized protein n=1 Tax=Oedothorax gibbosus TaxID=931172 RepID=A0AAV6TJ45_9ARAC|nr:hypothetical protein JTE90_013790 [Oedothorax gibbosus]
MDEIREEFYVALPSNSSFNFYPDNTQSSYCTKLASALMLEDNFECGVKEIFIPRNYFNVGEHNNGYLLTSNKDIERPDFKEYKIDFHYTNTENTVEF